MGKVTKIIDELEKGKKLPVGTVSHGRKKVAEGKWVDAKKESRTGGRGDQVTRNFNKMSSFEQKRAVKRAMETADLDWDDMGVSYEEFKSGKSLNLDSFSSRAREAIEKETMN